MSTQVASGKGTSVTDLAWNAIQGAYDLQVHVAPDVIERRIDDVGLAQEFLARGLKGFVLKSHYIPTAERAKVVCRAVPGIQAYGALTLNHSIGGLNPVAVELAGRGIRVNAVCPGPIDTPMLNAEFASAAQPLQARLEEIASVPLGRLGAPSDIAAVVAFLASDAAKFVTGVAWSVDGGKTAR